MSEKDNSSTNVNNEVSLKELILKAKELFFYLLKKWFIILIFGIIGGILGLVYALNKKTDYVARLTFAVQEKGGSSGGLAALAGQFGVNIGGGTEGVFSGSNIIELLKSKNLIERALLSTIVVNGKKQRLVDYYVDCNKLNEKKKELNLPIITFPLDLERENFSRAQDSTLNVLALTATFEKLEIARLSKEASIIIVKLTNEDELFTKYFTEILVKEVTDFYVRSRTELPRVNLIKLEHSADSVKREIDALLLKRAIYSDRNFDSPRQITHVTQQKDEIRLQLLGTVYAEMCKNVEATKMDLMRETPLVQIIDSPILPLDMLRLGKMRGMIIGGFLGFFLIVAYLLAVLFYRRIMSGEEGES